MSSGDRWMSCSACRTGIGFGARHYVCSVSTCNRSRTRLVFCSVGCWDSHLSILRHREAWAVEEKAPTREAWEAEQRAGGGDGDGGERRTEPTARRVVAPAASGDREPAGRPTPGAPAGASSSEDHEVLIVVSRLKKYIKDRSGMSTSDAVAEALSDHVRALCDQAIRAAGAAGRRTVLDRDVPPITR